jgi:hypothetical protein
MLELTKLEFHVGDDVIVLGSISAVVEHVCNDPGEGVKITVSTENSGRVFWTVVPAYWLAKVDG